jgi:TRAP-type C4-dicarboxylate transport system permease small subunit
MEFLIKIRNALNWVMVVLGGMSVLMLMILATGNVCMRIFQVPFRGAYELVSFLGAVTISFALGYTQMRKSHIVVDILSETFPDRVKRLLDAVSYFITMIFFALIAWVIFRWGIRIAQSGELSETLKVIYYPFIFSVGLGFAFLSLTLIIDFLNAMRKKER